MYIYIVYIYIYICIKTCIDICVPYSGDHPNTIQLLGYPHDAIPKMVPREGTTDEGQRVDVGSVAGGRLQAGHPDETRDFPGEFSGMAPVTTTVCIHPTFWGFNIAIGNCPVIVSFRMKHRDFP